MSGVGGWSRHPILAPIRAILFDKDGTLLDYDATWVPINREVALFAAGGDQALAAELLRAGGQDPVTNVVTSGTVLAVGSLDEIADTFAARLGPRTPRHLGRDIERIFREGGARHSVLLDRAAETLRALRSSGLRLGVASNDTAAGIEASLGRHGLLALFDFLAGCDSGHGAKPAPGMGLAFAAAVGLAPAACAMVGDAVHDMAMARAAGYGARIAVTTGTSDADELGPHSDLLIGALSELIAQEPIA